VNTTRDTQHRTQLQHVLRPNAVLGFWLAVPILIVVSYLTASHRDQARPELAT
jgi:hypothetical protein